MNSYKKIKSPTGDLTLIASSKHLLAVAWKSEDAIQKFKAEKNPNHPILKKTEKQLKEYFEGKRKTFTLPLQFNGTPFQEKVWKGLCEIPYGETVSYQWLANKVGSSTAVRAVGAANGKNWIPIIVPCHRVIGSNGMLTGFAGGLPNKKMLLKLEDCQLNWANN